MNDASLRRVFLVTLAALLGLGALAAAAVLAGKPAGGKGPVPVSAEAFGGPFALTAQDGSAFTEKDLEGRYSLIYFGFTYCPAICPTELQKMTTALEILGPQGEQVLPVFITVDPERDTVDVMKNYVPMFHPRLKGLTGTRAQVDQALKAYKVYAAKVQDPSLTDYTMDHSSFIYFIDPKGRLLSLYRIDDTAQAVADDMKVWLDHSVSG